MKEHPILFSTNMVKAILEGRKAQTRRALKPQPLNEIPMNVPDEWVALTEVNPNHGKVIKCRFGQIGDRLWVRETVHNDDEARRYYYKADPPRERFYYEGEWKPSIFMPRWASRITLEITGVRVERLQEISLADIQAEGIYDDRATHNAPLQLGKFQLLWDSINEKHPWSSNPWAWVIEFNYL